MKTDLLSDDVNDNAADIAAAAAANAVIDAANRGDAASQAALAQGLPAVAPDFAEQELGDEIDNIVPDATATTRLPIVALGGSAGSIPALRTFFENAAARVRGWPTW